MLGRCQRRRERTGVLRAALSQGRSRWMVCGCDLKKLCNVNDDVSVLPPIVFLLPLPVSDQACCCCCCCWIIHCSVRAGGNTSRLLSTSFSTKCTVRIWMVRGYRSTLARNLSRSQPTHLVYPQWRSVKSKIIRLGLLRCEKPAIARSLFY